VAEMTLQEFVLHNIGQEDRFNRLLLGGSAGALALLSTFFGVAACEIISKILVTVAMGSFLLALSISFVALIKLDNAAHRAIALQPEGVVKDINKAEDGELLPKLLKTRRLARWTAGTFALGVVAMTVIGLISTWGGACIAIMTSAT